MSFNVNPGIQLQIMSFSVAKEFLQWYHTIIFVKSDQKIGSYFMEAWAKALEFWPISYKDLKFYSF